ncbi:TetR/AcrR family transcriptional regulator [Rhodanobacter sp. MP7CTX1]|uniref:TetR/AcrR family transcriptional regulator n=1 Tax=Rhodanobacter sp. MP7CTX1 TaxID=2723084 RepID=UPI001616AFAB|nr:TetR/AcrR family transcriptional regulator [Rhodanobacter sp. MP7CTX1]MBB6186131.1 AcrR family transcriptional regulator [Rhodanobacter sp. MP7CTX1]
MNSEISPKQARSRATAERLLAAAIRVVDEAGLEGATVPRIAAAADVAPASVYRRYADKDALLRAAFLHALESSNQNNRQVMKKLLLRKNLESTVTQVIRSLFEQHRRHPLLMRALVRYLDASGDRAFVIEARRIMAANLSEVAALLMHHRDEIKRLNPERALRFAVLNAACSVEAHALNENSMWQALPDVTDESLASDLTASFVAYLRNR